MMSAIATSTTTSLRCCDHRASAVTTNRCRGGGTLDRGQRAQPLRRRQLLAACLEPGSPAQLGGATWRRVQQIGMSRMRPTLGLGLSVAWCSLRGPGSVVSHAEASARGERDGAAWRGGHGVELAEPGPTCARLDFILTSDCARLERRAAWRRRSCERDVSKTAKRRWATCTHGVRARYNLSATCQDRPAGNMPRQIWRQLST